MYVKWKSLSDTGTINVKELSEVEWMNGDFLFKDAWLRLINWLNQLIMNLFARNWKQCVFKKMYDDRDSGLIKVTTELVVLVFINQAKAN